MTEQTIWKASEVGNLDRVKHLIEVENVDINSKNNVIKYLIYFFILFIYFRLDGIL